MNKKDRNKTPVPRPNHFGETFHYDIGHGGCTAIGGVKYALFIVDRKSRNKFIFPLTDLEDTTILRQIKQFIRQIGFYPKEMLADRDFKLIGGIVAAFFDDNFTLTAGAPGHRQNQNGLAEANWKYLCTIARNYLTEHYLPMKF